MAFRGKYSFVFVCHVMIPISYFCSFHTFHVRLHTLVIAHRGGVSIDQVCSGDHDTTRPTSSHELYLLDASKERVARISRSLAVDRLVCRCHISPAISPRWKRCLVQGSMLFLGISRRQRCVYPRSWRWNKDIVFGGDGHMIPYAHKSWFFLLE